MNAPARLPADMFDAALFKAQLDNENEIQCCKAAIANTTQYLHQQFRQGAQARDLIRQRAMFIDTLLGILWDRQNWEPSELAMVAVGGYGRGELHPHSDVDLLFLLGSNGEDCKDVLSKFLTLLWDIGLNIGHSVRDVADCVEQAAGDITILTNLMEARIIRGPEHLMQQVRTLTGPDKMWSSQDFFQAKLQEQTTRHTKFADTEYN
ncbi:MAG: nucleotidyltransferase domain-containing protein, partial [Halioglobus sp.]